MEAQLKKTPQGLILVLDENQKLHLDFVQDRRHYQKSHRGKNELIAKAVGLGRGFFEVWDMTAGLLEDAVLLAQIGARVRAFEREPLLAQLVEDALIRAQQSLGNQSWTSKVTIEALDSIQFLKNCPEGSGPEVIYLDPMFEIDKKKSALPRKEMQFFRKIVGPNEDSGQLLLESLRVAKNRVVVKRPIKAKPLLAGAIHQFEGTAIRYDLYNPTHRGFRKES